MNIHMRATLQKRERVTKSPECLMSLPRKTRLNFCIKKEETLNIRWNRERGGKEVISLISIRGENQVDIREGEQEGILQVHQRVVRVHLDKGDECTWETGGEKRIVFAPGVQEIRYGKGDHADY